MKKLFKVLKFFRLVDENNQLSLTNIAVMVGISKIALTQATSMEDLGLFIIRLMGYAHKKHIGKDK